MSRKEDILTKALEMFNDCNTQAATTNHIAKALGISPGNLHYHYKNREEIVRLLYINMRKEMTLAVGDLPKSIDDLLEHEEDLITIRWKYRFFFRELLFLFSRDKELEELYIEDNILHRSRIKQSMINLKDNNELTIKDEKTLEFLTDSILLSWQFYTSYAYTLGNNNNESVGKLAIEYTNNAMQPYIIKKRK